MLKQMKNVPLHSAGSEARELAVTTGCGSRQHQQVQEEMKEFNGLYIGYYMG